MRIDRFLSNLKYGSRSEIKEFIKKKLVYINNQLCKNANQDIDPNIDEVSFNGEKVFFKDNICIAFNKPKNYICSNIDEKYPSILRLLPKELQRLDLKICGRLDYDTEGLVVITTNGDYVHKIISPKKDLDKIYYVETTDKIVNYDKLINGVEILDGRNQPYFTKSANVEIIDDNKAYITISEGKFHQVKRMFEAIDNEVIYLKRIAVGKYYLPEDLKLSEYLIIRLEDII